MTEKKCPFKDIPCIREECKAWKEAETKTIHSVYRGSSTLMYEVVAHCTLITKNPEWVNQRLVSDDER